MLAYHIALFLHITGVAGLFAGLGLELATLLRLRRAETVAQVREALWFGPLVGRLMPRAALLTLAAGLYMAVTAWGFEQAWLDVALGVFLMLALGAPALNGRHMRAIAASAFQAPDGAIPLALRARVVSPALTTSVLTSTTLTLGIVFLMTVKPSLTVALSAIGVALLLGLGSALPARRAARRAATPVAQAAHSPVLVARE
jgi:hypothetical protein